MVDSKVIHTFNEINSSGDSYLIDGLS